MDLRNSVAHTDSRNLRNIKLHSILMTPTPQSPDADVAFQNAAAVLATTNILMDALEMAVKELRHASSNPGTRAEVADRILQILKVHQTTSRTQPPACAPAQGVKSQGRCDTTLTERFENPDCTCLTYAGNLGPCADHGGPSNNGRCVYCDHEMHCKPYLAPAQPVNTMLVEALNHAILLLESSLQGQLGAFVNAMREEELPYLRNVAITAAQQPGAGVDGWRDIATAPRDGTVIVVRGYVKRIALGRCDREYFYVAEYHKDFNRFITPDGTEVGHAYLTHWMPLHATSKPTGGEG